jgi:hypothetical protein
MVEVVEFPMAVMEVAIDPPATYGMTRVVGVGYGKALEDAKLGFDQVEPRSFRRSPNRMDAQAPQQRQEARMIVDVVQVIQNDEELFSPIAPPETAESFRDFHDSLPAAEPPVQTIGMHIVKAKKLFGAFQSAIRGTDALRLFLPGPSDAADRLQFQRAPFVETNYCAARRTAPIERPDAFFLRSKAGSVEVFQVRTRWALSPSRRSRRRTHSSVTGGSSFRRRQYSASLGTDQTEKGKPRSAGLERATSTSSRSCSARRIGGRPLGLGTCSKVAKPVRLNR